MRLQRMLSVLLVCLMALGPVAPGLARADDPLPAGYSKAVDILSMFGLVAGDAGGYRPNDSLTRAEVSKLAVSGMAMADQQSYYQSQNYFPDVNGHWAQGFIGLARQVGLVRGYPDGAFHPDDTVSYAEAIALMARVAGLGPSGGEWPANWVHAAQDARIIPENAPYLSKLSEPAKRGEVFVLLYRALTEVKDFTGQSLLQRRFKPLPPAIMLDTIPISTQDTSLTVTGSVDSAVEVTINQTKADLTGKLFRAQVPLNIGVNEIVVTARDVVGNVNSYTRQVVRDNTDPATITITGSHQFAAGSAGHLDMVVKDTNGAPITRLYGLMATVPPSLGSFDPYTGTIYTPQQPASGTIVVTMGDAKATWQVTVGAGNLVKYKISPENPLVKRGQELTFQVAGEDQYGNQVDASGLQVNWSVDRNGVINQLGRFASTANGPAVVTAVIGEEKVTTKAIVYGPPAKVSLVPSGSMIANNEDTMTVELQAQDTEGNLVPDYAGVFYVSSTLPSSFTPTTTSVPASKGKATVTLRAASQAGVGTLVAQADQIGSSSVAIEVKPQTVSGITLSMEPPTLNADGVTKQALYLTAVDIHGKPLLSPLNPPLTVHLVGSSAITAIFEASGNNAADVSLGAIDPATRTVRNSIVLQAGTQEGITNISGLVQSPQQMAALPVRTLQVRGVKVGTGSKIAFDPVQAVEAGTTVPLYLRLLDAKGFQVSKASDLQNVLLTVKDQSGTIYPATVSLVQGNGRAEYDILAYKAGTYTFTATAVVTGGGTPVVPASQTLVLGAGPAVSLSLSALPSLLKLDGGVSRSTLTATVQDAYGNVVPTGTFSVHFQRSQGNGATGTFQAATVDTSQGIARVLVPSGQVPGTDAFIAQADGLTTKNSVTISSVIMGIPSKLAIRYGDNNGDGLENGVGDSFSNVGTPVTVYVDILDNDSPGNLYTAQSGQIASLTVKNLATGDQQILRAPVSYGTAAFTFTRDQASTYALQASLGGLTGVATAGLGGSVSDLVLKSGSGATLVVKPDLQTLKATSTPATSNTKIVVALADSQGNPTVNTSGSPLQVTLKASNKTYGWFTQDGTPTGIKTDTIAVTIANNAAESSAGTWYAGAMSGPVTIAASGDQLATGTAMITTRIVGPAARLSVSPLVNTVTQPFAGDDSTVTGQDVLVTVLDESGSLVNDYGSSGEQISLTAMDPESVITAYYDYNQGLWRSLDLVPGNNAGEYPTTYAVIGNNGRAWFRTRAASSGSYRYVVANGSAPQTATLTLNQTGNFTAGPLARLDLTATPNYDVSGTPVYPVAGGGKTIAVTARAVDIYGNLIKNQVGNVYFQIQGGQYGALLSTNASLQNGVATAIFQSTSAAPLPNGTLQVTAYTNVTQPNGQPLLVGTQTSPASVTVTVDSIAPSVSTVTLAPGGGSQDVVTAGDGITVNFSEAIRPTSIYSGLSLGSTLSTGIGGLRVHFSHAAGGVDTITFGGGLNVGTFMLRGANMDLGPGNTVLSYDVSSLSLSPDGKQLLITLGSSLTAQPVGLQLAADPTQTTFTPTASLADLAGNAINTNLIQVNPGSRF